MSTTVVVENEKIRVTLPKELFDEYFCRDRIEYLKSGDRRVHSGESERRGRILSDAMMKLANDQEYQRIKDTPPKEELDINAALEVLRLNYRDEYLRDNNCYGDDLWIRLEQGARMSAGMRDLVSKANAYASGKVGECDADCIHKQAYEIFKQGLPQYREQRELNKLKLRSRSNASEELDKELLEAAINLRDLENYVLDVEKRYRNRFADSAMSIEILRPDLMPASIGTCRFTVFTVESE